MEIDPAVVRIMLDKASESPDRQFFNEDDEEDPVRLGVTHVELFYFCPKIEENLVKLVNREIIDETLGSIANADEDHVDAQRHYFGSWATDYEAWIIRVYADKEKTRYTPAFEKAYEMSYRIGSEGDNCLDEIRLYEKQQEAMYESFREEVKTLDIQNMGKHRGEEHSEMTDLELCVETIIEWMTEQPKCFASLEDRGSGAYPDPEELDEACRALGYIYWDDVIGHMITPPDGIFYDKRIYLCAEDSEERMEYSLGYLEDIDPCELQGDPPPFEGIEIKCEACGKILNQVTYEWETPLPDPRQMELPI